MDENISFVADRDDTERYEEPPSVIDLHCFLNSIVSDLTFLLVCRHRQDKFKFLLMHAAVYLL